MTEKHFCAMLLEVFEKLLEKTVAATKNGRHDVFGKNQAQEAGGRRAILLKISCLPLVAVDF
jgi:hypothetical protein